MEDSLEETKPSADEVIASWKADCGEVKSSERGTTFLVIPIADRRGHFLNLIQSFIHYGFTKEEIKSAAISTKVVKTCWSDLIQKMSAKDIKKSRDISRNQWEGALEEVFKLKIYKYVKEKKEKTLDDRSVAELEKILEEIENPKDKIISQKIDRSANINWELMKELGLEPDEDMK